MKQFIKYSLIFFCFFFVLNKGFSQNNRKKAVSTVSKKNFKKTKKKKITKTTIRKKIKKGKGKIIPSLIVNTPQFSIKETNKIIVDTVPEKEVSIISAFKPQLKNIAKISFTQSTFKKDTNTVTLNYEVPTQNLSFQYKPISLIPRTFSEKATNYPLDKTNFKVGFGNYSQQLFDLNYNSHDDKNNSHSVNAYFESSNGMYYLQQYQHKNISYLGNIQLNNQNSFQIETFYQNYNRYRFGLVPDNRNLILSNYEQPFSLMSVSLKWVNNNVLREKTYFNPLLRWQNFKGWSNTHNVWFEVFNPMSFPLKAGGKLNLDVSYNYNTYSYSNFTNTKNSIFSMQPSIEIDKWNASIKVGVNPTWDMDKFALYPLIQFSKKLNDTNYLLVANWQTNLTNNNYAGLSMVNPWLSAPLDLKITSQEKKSIELFINATKKLQYSFGLSLNDYRNIPFFNRVNNVSPSQFYGLSYQVVFEKRAITLEFISQLKYQLSNQFLMHSKLQYLQFNSIKENTNAWGILPLTFSTDVQWWAHKKWFLNGEIQYWTGASYSNNVDKVYTTTNALVLNTSFHYLLTSHLTAWAKAENLLDKKYQRWAEYPSLGVQLIAGIVYSFHK